MMEKVTVNTDKELIHRLWENYYVPYMKGYFSSYGKFASDDVKTGDILAYTGSTASAFYFPDKVEKEDDSYPIEYVVQESPIMEGRRKLQSTAGRRNGCCRNQMKSMNMHLPYF